MGRPWLISFRKGFAAALIVGLVSVVTVSTVKAQAPPVSPSSNGEGIIDRQKEAKETLARILPHSRITPTQGRATPRACRDPHFFDDLIAGRNVEFVEPELRVARFDDPQLDRYKALCPNLELNDYWYIEGIEYLKDVPRSEWHQYGKQSHARRNIAIYRLDMNNDSSDGDELVVYGEGLCDGYSSDRLRECLYDALFKTVDLKQCTEQYIFLVPRNLFKLIKDGIEEHVAAIIKYKNSNMFLFTTNYSDDLSLIVQNILGFPISDNQDISGCSFTVYPPTK